MPVPVGDNQPGAGLPPGWQNLPTTEQSLEAAAAIIGREYGAAEGSAFQAWYRAAWAKDPSITPDQAAAAWVTGAALSGGVSAAGGLLGQVPAAAASALQGTTAVKGANSVAAAVSNPLAFLRNIGAFFDKLSEASTWLRIGEFLLGAALVVVGVAKLASGTAAGRAAGKVAKVAALA